MGDLILSCPTFAAMLYSKNDVIVAFCACVAFCDWILSAQVWVVKVTTCFSLYVFQSSLCFRVFPAAHVKSRYFRWKKLFDSWWDHELLALTSPLSPFPIRKTIKYQRTVDYGICASPPRSLMLTRIVSRWRLVCLCRMNLGYSLEGKLVRWSIAILRTFH